MRVSHETLPSGMQALFLSSPRFKTTSASLSFAAGSLHENKEGPAGVAHFLEHTPFQGTRDLPSLWDLEDYADYDGTEHNAATSQTDTSYVAYGVDPLRVMNLVFQMGFHPLLTEAGLNRDRNAVVEEAREAQYDPFRAETEAYLREFGGTHYAKLVTGNVEDVLSITHDDIMTFYRRHYQPSNACLLVCSPLGSRALRGIAVSLEGDIDTTRTTTSPEPVRLDLPWLKHPEPVTTFHNKRDDTEAQSGVSVGYRLEMPETFRDYVLHELGAMLIYRTLHRTLRDDRNLVYGVNADYGAVENIGHGQLETYYCLEVGTQLHGSNMVSALDAILMVEAEVKSGEARKYADPVLRGRVRDIKKRMESGTELTIEQMSSSAQLYYDKTYDLRAEQDIVEGMTAEEVVGIAAAMMKDKRLTSIAGPSVRQLRKAAAHAEKHV